MGILDAFYSLSSRTNKVKGSITPETEQGVVSEKFPELKLNLPNEEISKLTEQWEREWTSSEVFAEWSKMADENVRYWKGKQFDIPKGSGDRPLMDNVIFEALETYLPQTTRRNPDPIVTLAKSVETTPENEKFAKDLKDMLAEIADEIVLRLKLKKSARHWALLLLGAIKVGWDVDRDIPTAKAIRAKKLILDPNAVVDEDGYSGRRIGEYRKLPASDILTMLDGVGEDEGIKKIKALAMKNNVEALGTEIQFIEWWTQEYMCWTLDKAVLLKIKNPHWNYDKEGEPQIDEATGEQIPATETITGFNHFSVPGLPYILLSVFNLGTQPVDDVSLIGQNLAAQDLVNKRLRQIDKNADSMNGGMVVSGEHSGLNEGQAQKVTMALRKGGTVWIPAGTPDDAIKRMSAPALPGDIYTQLQDTRIRMRDIFGTSGSSPAGLSSEQTVRGKMQNRILDTDRIGGGFSEYLEQMADKIYNWFVQLLYVYDDRYIGKTLPKVRVSVKEGSLIPKDSLTLANQAIELAGTGKMSLIDMYKALDYTNPEEMAANVWLEINAPEVLFNNDPRIQQVIQQRQAAAQAGGQTDKPVSKSINFKDLPPEGQAQLAEQAGIKLHPEALAAHSEFKSEAEAARSRPVLPETITE